MKANQTLPVERKWNHELWIGGSEAVFKTLKRHSLPPCRATQSLSGVVGRCGNILVHLCEGYKALPDWREIQRALELAAKRGDGVVEFVRH